MTFLDEVSWGHDGLIAAVAQDAATGRVLTVAWMNREALEQSVERGEAVYWSRSRKRLWRKGEESGHVQQVKSVRTDCDADVLLIEVEQVGVACHEGYRSCFYRRLDGTQWAVADERKVDPSAVYSKASGQPPGPGTTFMRSGRRVCSSRRVPPTATASR